jgi:hypothetical protein
VNTNGTRSRNDEIMWPSKPQSVAYNEPYLLCFSERGIDVFHVKTGEWIQILQFSKTKPLDKTGSLCLCNESPDSIRLIHFKAIGEEETISLMTKTRSLVKSKLRKASLSRSDETYLTLSNNSTSSAGQPQQPQPIVGGSTALNYSNSTASSSGASNSNSNSRKSLISNPINFQHLQHMGPSDGKTFMSEPPSLVQPSTSSINTSASSAPSNGNRVLNASSLNNTSLLNEQPNTTENYYKVPSNQAYSQASTSKSKSNSSSGVRQIAKQEISAPTNFRHVVKGLEELGTLANSKELMKPNHFNPTGLNSTATANNQQQTIAASGNNTGSKSSMRQPSSLMNNAAAAVSDTQASSTSNVHHQHHHHQHHHPHSHQQQQQPTYIKTSSLSSSSSSSSSILHSPNSPSLSNNENLSHAINNTLKANSVLYNGKQVE